jgi:outer membrane protein TolC
MSRKGHDRIGWMRVTEIFRIWFQVFRQTTCEFFNQEPSMTRRTTILLLGLPIATAVGCSSAFDDGPMSEWVRDDPATWQVTPAGAVHGRSSLASHLPEDSPAQLRADAGPEDFVRMALEQNPDVQAAQRKVERLLARLPQARSLDDPILKVAPIGDMAETAAGQVGTMTGVSQKLPLPGKLEAREQIAAHEAAGAAAELESVKLRVTADTRRAWWSHYFAVRAIEVTRKNRDLLSQFKKVAESKYKAGTASQQDVLRASVELSNLDNELITLNQRKTTSRAMLNNLLDRPVNAPLPEPPAVQLQRVSLELENLLAEAARSNPELKKINERIKAFRERLRLAKLDRWPDLTVSLNYNFVRGSGLSPAANGDDQWWVGFGLNLPIWQEKLDAAEREARMGVMQSASELSGVRNRVAFRIQDAMVRVETQQRLVILFRDVIVPQAKQTLDVSTSGYRAGKIDFLTLVDNWRKLLSFQLLYHQSLGQLEQNFAELQQVVGNDLERRGPAAPATQSDLPDDSNRFVRDTDDLAGEPRRPAESSSEDRRE